MTPKVSLSEVFDNRGVTIWLDRPGSAATLVAMNREHPTPTPDALGERLTEVFDLVGPLYRRVSRAVESSEPVEGLSVGVRAILDLLRSHDPMTVPQMGRALALSRQFIQRMVNDAVAAGLVEPIPNPAHSRSSLIRPTPAGLAAITAVRAREHELLRQVGGDLTMGDIDACLRVLAAMYALFADVDVD